MQGVDVGTMLLVPFGRRRVLGVVVDVASESAVPPERLVEPIKALESGVPPELVRLGLWVADDYCSTPARGLALVLPPGTGTGRRASPAARSRLRLVAELTGAGREALASAASVRLSDGQRCILESLREGPLAATEVGVVTGAKHGALRRGGPAGRGGAGAAGASGGQAAALDAVLEPLRARRHERLLLHGVTGSGKTEVYLRAAAAAIEAGRTAIVLVPEIALTPQAARRFRARFGDTVAVIHSQLGLGERYDEWQRLRRGEARVCVGPRSAVFAPLRDLGLLVVDEEHDSAYKQEGDPRYDARRVAERRAEQAGAVLVLGSATPRPESWQRTRRLSLPERADGMRLPPVEIVDMRDARHTLHRRTRQALDELRREGGKGIVLVNRRGWSPFLVCRSCGETWSCPHCDVTLTLHREPARNGQGQVLRCHHCGHARPVPSVCSHCSSTHIARHGAGTQRLEAELAEALAPLPVFRLDSDAARRKHGLAEVLDQFERAPAGILVGTQMVAQGHDFPEVSLAVVQDADAALRFPDFRSEERTFSLVAQLAGRSGRGPCGGRVLVQTMWPDSACLRHAARHDAPSFLAEELERRRVLRYPPFTDLVRVVASAPEQPQADAVIARVLEGIDARSLDVLGPAPLFRLKDRSRSMLLVKTTDRQAAVAAVGRAVQRVTSDRKLKSVALSVDVDPQ
jgi:primosomal protein N' (replication factor Y)